jgi:large subunit ribosomal protein L29
MALSKIQEIRELGDQEITDQIASVKKELFQLRFQKATRRLEKPHQFKHLRHRLAQLMTVEHERRLAAAQSTQDSQSASEEK